MNKQEWLAVKKLMEEKYLFNSIEHDRLIIAESTYDTCYLVAVHDVECDSMGFPVDLELMDLEDDLQHYIEMGRWGEALERMQIIDQVVNDKNN